MNFPPNQDLISGIRPRSYKIQMCICLHVLPYWKTLLFTYRWYLKTSFQQSCSLLSIVPSCVIIPCEYDNCVNKYNAESEGNFCSDETWLLLFDIYQDFTSVMFKWVIFVLFCFVLLRIAGQEYKSLQFLLHPALKVGYFVFIKLAIHYPNYLSVKASPWCVKIMISIPFMWNSRNLWISPFYWGRARIQTDKNLLHPSEVLNTLFWNVLLGQARQIHHSPAK